MLPTENPRVTITMSEEQLEEIREYLYKNKLKNQTQAILSLINKGFEALNICASEQKTAPAKVADAASERLLLNFTQLDRRGRDMLLEISEVMVDSGRYARLNSTRRVAARNGRSVTAEDAGSLDELIDPESFDI